MSEAYQSAMLLLSRREHGRCELALKLKQKGWDKDTVDQVIHRLIQEGSLSDERYVEMVFRSQIQQGAGPIKIQNYLRSKGVSDALINWGLATCGANWPELLYVLWKKKYDVIGPQYSKLYEKQVRFFLQRGFSMEVIQKFFQTMYLNSASMGS